MVKGPTQVIPCGCVIRCKRNLSLDKASDRVQGHRHVGAGQISAPLYANRLKKLRRTPAHAAPPRLHPRLCLPCFHSRMTRKTGDAKPSCCGRPRRGGARRIAAHQPTAPLDQSERATTAGGSKCDSSWRLLSVPPR